jgi:cathepsin B
MMKHGSVSAAYHVYSDFPAYESGVYHKTAGAESLGGHAVKLVGWGVENGEDYWLAANSWDTTWGDKGFFKIKRGVNECGIEDDVMGGIVEHDDELRI